MKATIVAKIILALFATSVSVRTPAQSFTFSNTVNTVVPDANPNGLFSTINVSGISGTVGRITLSLNISGGFNGDLYGYLTCDNGGFAVLLNRTGRTGSDPT